MLRNPFGALARRAASASASTSSSSSLPTISAAATSASSSSRSFSSYGSYSSAHHPVPSKYTSASWHSTTILCVRKDGRVCMIGDGMVSMGNVTIKPNARKIRRIATKTDRDRIIGGGGGGGGDKKDGDKDKDGSEEKGEEECEGGVMVGFAGATADAFTLVERLEGKIDEYPNQLARSCVELAKGWRTDKYLRRLEASMLVADSDISLEITGNGDVLESHDGVMGVGSGAFFAMAAARALIDVPDLSAEDVARKSMKIASDMCVYTNDTFVVETMVSRAGGDDDTEDGDKDGDEDEEDK